ncbi:MAG: PIG-L family deacetylase [Opitutae bacterium]|jgi:N-acetylglucosamine malate deacetylase 1|nr:PIG-L family deacetylase [Opitutae bacterium]
MIKNPYFSYTESFKKITESGKNLPYGNFEPLPKVQPKNDAPIALIMSPHPDDECIIGGLPLRLMRETGFRIVNVAITLGSNLDRRKERLRELHRACEWIGFELQEMGDSGLEKVTVDFRQTHPRNWAEMVNKLQKVIEKWNPTAIFFPNSHDWNKTHLGVHMLTLDALNETNDLFPFLIETEYWGQMPKPNLLVESTTQEVADLLAALSHHEGELKRNPFHLRMPAWMQDNVRRGAEVVGGQGGEAPEFDFASLYRVTRWKEGKMLPAWQGGKMLPSKNNSHETIFSN